MMVKYRSFGLEATENVQLNGGDGGGRRRRRMIYPLEKSGMSFQQSVMSLSGSSRLSQTDFRQYQQIIIVPNWDESSRGPTRSSRDCAWQYRSLAIWRRDAYVIKSTRVKWPTLEQTFTSRKLKTFRCTRNQVQ